MLLRAITLIILITYSVFNTAWAQETAPKQHFAVAVNLLQISEDNVGFGFNYEHFLNSNGTVSLYFPFSYALPVSKDSRNYRTPQEEYYQYSSSPQYLPSISQRDEWSESRGMAYFYPGVKFYTAKKLRHFTYCLGASLIAGIGTAELRTIDYAIDTISNNAQYLVYKRREVNNTSEMINRVKLGMMVTNAINIRIEKHIYTGIELGLGYTYVNSEGNQNIQRGMMVQAGLKLGYYQVIFTRWLLIL